MGNLGILLPVPVVAAVVAYFYGRSIHSAWLPAIITFICVLVGGLLFQGVGQIAGVVLSALIIFLLFTHPAQKRAAEEAAAREKTTNILEMLTTAFRMMVK